MWVCNLDVVKRPLLGAAAQAGRITCSQNERCRCDDENQSSVSKTALQSSTTVSVPVCYCPESGDSQAMPSIPTRGFDDRGNSLTPHAKKADDWQVRQGEKNVSQGIPFKRHRNLAISLEAVAAGLYGCSFSYNFSRPGRPRLTQTRFNSADTCKEEWSTILSRISGPRTFCEFSARLSLYARNTHIWRVNTQHLNEQ